MLKPDLGVELENINDSNSLYEEAKTIKSGGGDKDLVQKSDTAQSFISDSMSVQSSYLDRISSIFTFGR